MLRDASIAPLHLRGRVMCNLISGERRSPGREFYRQRNKKFDNDQDYDHDNAKQITKSLNF